MKWEEASRTIYCVFHEMDGWGCPPHGTADHCTKGTLFTRGFVFQVR